MAKLLCSSLLRGFWSGRIIVFRNFEQPLFPVERKGLDEVFIETSALSKGMSTRDSGQASLSEALQARFKAVEWIEDPCQYDWISYLDADCLALRDIEHLFAGEADVLVQGEEGRLMWSDRAFNGYFDPKDARPRPSGRNGWLGRTGINAGTFAVRGNKFTELLDEWRRIYESSPAGHTEFRDQTAFNKLLMETSMKVQAFERGEIMFPFHLDKGFLDYNKAALLHFVGGEQKDKIGLAFGLHMMRTYGEEGGLFLDLMES